MKKYLLLFTMLAAFFSLGAVNEQDKALLTSETQLLKNPGFEGGISEWTASGGSFSATNINPLFGKLSGSWDSDGSAQTLDSPLYPITQGFLNGTCQAEVRYEYPVGTDGDYKLVVRQFDDSGATENDVAELALEVATNTRPAQLFFDCPDDVADDLRLRIESTVANADPIKLDNAFIGTGRNTFQLSQAALVTYAKYPVTTNCGWSLNSATYADFGPDSDCPSISVIDSDGIVEVDTADNDLPDLDYDTLPKGKYLVEAVFSGAYTDSLVHIKGWRITDGTTIGPECGTASNVTTGGTDPQNVKCSMVFNHDGGAVNLKLQGIEDASGSVQILNQENGQELTWTVTRFPTSSAEAITLETSGFFLDVNIGGANPNLGTGDVVSYTAIGDAGLDLVNNNPAFSAKIPCDGGNPSTGSTCSAGNEIVGVVFDAPTAGKYRACFDFTHQTSSDVAGLSETTFQIIETADGSGTILSEGNTRIGSSSDVSSSATSTGAQPIVLCGIFDFGSPGEKALKLAFEQSASPNFNSNIIRADRNTSIGQRDIHVTVEKLTEQKPTPVFTDLQNSLNSKVETNVDNTRICSFTSGSTGSTPVSDITSCISSVAALGSARLEITWNAGTWGPGGLADYSCTCTSGGGSDYNCDLANQVQNSIEFHTFDNAGTAANRAIDVICHGIKGN